MAPKRTQTKTQIIQMEHAAAERRSTEFDKYKKKADEARVGFAKMDLFGKVRLTFGRFNIRGLNASEVRNLRTSFVQSGVRRYHGEHAIPVIANRDTYDVETITRDAEAREGLPEIRWTRAAEKAGAVVAAGGRHRYHALEQWKTEMENQLEAIRKMREKEEERCEDDETSGRLGELKEEEQELEKRLGEGGMWMIAIYDGETIAAEPSLGTFLSRNSNIHHYKETAEERMLLVFQQLNEARRRSEDEYTMTLERARTDATATSSTHSGVLHNEVAVEFYCRLMERGNHYATGSVMKLSWARAALGDVHGGILKGMVTRLLDMWEFLFVVEEFPSEEEIEQLHSDVDGADESKREVARARLARLATREEPRRDLMTKEVDIAIDEAYKERLSKLVHHMGSGHEVYVDAYVRYRQEVRRIVDKHLVGKGDDAEVTQIRHNLKAKLRYLNHASNPWFIGLLPFVTPSIPPMFHEWLGKIDRAINEVSHWVEPLSYFRSRLTRDHRGDDMSNNMLLNLQSRNSDVKEDAKQELVTQLIKYFVTEHNALLTLELYLTDPRNDIKRFTKQLDIIMTRKSHDSLADSAQPKRSRQAKADPKDDGTLIQAQNWLIEGLIVCLGRKSPNQAVTELSAEMAKYAKHSIPDTLDQMMGGTLVIRTAWPWQEVMKNSFNRTAMQVAQSAMYEHVVIELFRKKMMSSCWAANVIRRALGNIIQARMRSRNVIDAKRMANSMQTIAWTWPDKIDPTELTAQDQSAIGTTTLHKHIEASKEVAEDHDSIVKLIEGLERSTLVTRTAGGTAVAEEVRVAIDHLAAAINFNLTRRRGRARHGDDYVVVEDDVVPLRMDRRPYESDPVTEENPEKPREQLHLEDARRALVSRDETDPRPKSSPNINRSITKKRSRATLSEDDNDNDASDAVTKKRSRMTTPDVPDDIVDAPPAPQSLPPSQPSLSQPPASKGKKKKPASNKKPPLAIAIERPNTRSSATTHQSHNPAEDGSELTSPEDIGSAFVSLLETIQLLDESQPGPSKRPSTGRNPPHVASPTKEVASKRRKNRLPI